MRRTEVTTEVVTGVPTEVVTGVTTEVTTKVNTEIATEVTTEVAIKFVIEVTTEAILKMDEETPLTTPPPQTMRQQHNHRLYPLRHPRPTHSSFSFSTNPHLSTARLQ
ncbi:hypothetical protein J6590_003732 [Homalodisca vitripennis]|nr:hypothetical protein J6590_003732 [Homalodisca vitripennis]